MITSNKWKQPFVQYHGRVETPNYGLASSGRNGINLMTGPTSGYYGRRANNSHWLTPAGGWAASIGLVLIASKRIGAGDLSFGSLAAALESSG